jgi:hypothetical protein
LFVVRRQRRGGAHLAEADLLLRLFRRHWVHSTAIDHPLGFFNGTLFGVLRVGRDRRDIIFRSIENPDRLTIGARDPCLPMVIVGANDLYDLELVCFRANHCVHCAISSLGRFIAQANDSSARLIAGCFRFFTLTQCFDWPA